MAYKTKPCPNQTVKSLVKFEDTLFTDIDEYEHHEEYEHTSKRSLCCVMCRSTSLVSNLKTTRFASNCNRCKYCVFCYNYLITKSQDDELMCVSKVFGHSATGRPVQCAWRQREDLTKRLL